MSDQDPRLAAARIRRAIRELNEAVASAHKLGLNVKSAFPLQVREARHWSDPPPRFEHAAIVIVDRKSGEEL